MFATLWQTISQYFYLLIAIPCMSIFPFRFRPKFKWPAILAVTLIACALKALVFTLLDLFLPASRFSLGLLIHQSIYISFIIAASCLLYRGNIFSMLLAAFLSMSLAAQCGGILGGFLTLYKEETTIGMLIFRDTLGYSAYGIFYFFFWKHMHITSFYLDTRDHIVLLIASIINFVLTDSFTGTFMLGSPAAIPFYATCMFTTLSITFLMSLFARDHRKVQEQQLLIYEMKLSENTYAQMKETAAQMREIKHELSNYFIYARQLLDDGEYDILRKHIDDIIGSNIPLVETVSTDNSVVNSIVNQKNAYARSLNIKTDFQVKLPEHLSIDSLTLCTILGNLLNNAIEACHGLENPYIRLSVHPAKSYLCFQTDNSVSHDILKTNPHLLTTKENADYHGYGLRILRQMAKKYDGIFHYEMSAPGCFTVQLMLKC